MDLSKIGNFIRELRKAQGLTQKQLADALFITDRAVSKWERGLSAPDISLLEPLAQILHTSVAEIIAGEKLEQQANISHITKEIVSYSDSQTKTKVVRRKKGVYFRIITVIFSLVFVWLTAVQIGGDGFGWSCIPAHISLKKAVHAIENYDRTGMEENIRYSENMYNQLLALQDSGVSIRSRQTYITDVRLDDGFVFTETYFTVDYNGLTFVFICTGTYRNGKTELMYLLPGASSSVELDWILTLEDVLCTYYPG